MRTSECRYRCLSCGHEWVQTMFCGDPHGKLPAETAHPSCPQCTALYVKWLNYDEFEGRNG
jgi:DNA-directed RNA polymerase subunit RPC12/RpoP